MIPEGWSVAREVELAGGPGLILMCLICRKERPAVLAETAHRQGHLHCSSCKMLKRNFRLKTADKHFIVPRNKIEDWESEL